MTSWMQRIWTHSSWISKFSRNQRKSYNDNFYDDDSNGESELDQENSVLEFTTRVKESFDSKILSDDDFSNDNENASANDLYVDALAKAYKTLYLKLVE